MSENESKDVASAVSTGAPGAETSGDAPELEPLPGGPPPVPGSTARAARQPTADASSDDPAPLKTTTSLPPRAWPPRTLADVMTRKVITVREDEPVGDLERGMGRFGFHHLPVVTAEMKLVGLITRTDFLHAALGRTPHGAPAAPLGESTNAGEIMRRDVVTGTPDTDLLMACRVVLSEKLGCLPIILEDTTLVGIVTRTDLVQVLTDLLDQRRS